MVNQAQVSKRHKGIRRYVTYTEGQISVTIVCSVYQWLWLSNTLHLKRQLRELLSENADDKCQHRIQICLWEATAKSVLC